MLATAPAPWHPEQVPALSMFTFHDRNFRSPSSTSTARNRSAPGLYAGSNDCQSHMF